MKTSTTVLRRFGAGVAVATALIIGFATPASAATVTTTTAPVVANERVRITVGNYVYVTFNRGETTAIADKADYAGLMNFACSLVPNAAAKAACALLVGSSAVSTARTFRSAAGQSGKCAQMRWSYGLGWPFVIGGYNGSSVVNC